MVYQLIGFGGLLTTFANLVSSQNSTKDFGISLYEHPFLKEPSSVTMKEFGGSE